MEKAMILKKTYAALNARDIEFALTSVHPEVEWVFDPKQMIAFGHDELRACWAQVWEAYSMTMFPGKIKPQGNNLWIVEVKQVVKDLDGQIIEEVDVHHHVRFEEDMIRHLEVRDPPALTMSKSQDQELPGPKPE